jgi:hypothetical protein
MKMLQDLQRVLHKIVRVFTPCGPPAFASQRKWRNRQTKVYQIKRRIRTVQAFTD